jgi:hypothetical protein
MISPLAGAIAELLADPTVAGKVGTRVRSQEPASGDSKVPYQRFVVLAYLSAPPMPHMGIRDAMLSMRVYGTSYADAEALWIDCENVFRDRGARIVGTGRLGVYHSQVLGFDLEKDIDTAQPVASGTISYPVALAAVPS